MNLAKARLLTLGFCFFCSVAYCEEETPPWLQEVQVSHATAIIAKENGDWLASREELESILEKFPQYSQIGEIRKTWGQVMFHVIHSNLPVPEALTYEVVPGDTLEKIAKAHGTTIELIKKRNMLNSDFIKAGQKLSLWNRQFSIDVDKTRNRLDLKLGHRIVKEYMVSTGKAETVTPLGEFIIKFRYPDPTWFHHGKVIAGGAPDNLLGTRWLGFDKEKYGIHGTIYPQLIGQSVSAGCIRMKNEDVEELYDMIPIGTKVKIQGN